MRPLAHAVTSGIISILVWAHFKSIRCAVVSFMAGVLIDLDHFIDYYTNYGFSLKIKDIYYIWVDTKLKKLYLFLHSYELIILFWAAIYALSLSNVWKAAAIGLTQHLVFDQITNPLNTFGYFITYRMIKGFNKKLLIREVKD